MADEITTPTVGIFAGGKTEVTVNGIIYTGTSCSSISNAYKNDIAVVQDRTITGRTALRTANHTLIMDNVTANGCTGGNGGLFINDSTGLGNTVEVYNTTISDCGNGLYGGVVYSNTDSTFTFNNTVFSRNIAQNGGGAFYLTGNSESHAVLTLTDVQFIGNAAFNIGGALNIYNSELNVSNALFSGNLAGNGAAVYLDGSVCDAEITDTWFDGNTANGNGAAIYTRHGTHTFSGLTFTGNTAVGTTDNPDGLGNAIYNASATLTIDGATFGKNQTIYSNKNITFKGEIFLCDAWQGSGTYTVDGAKLIFNNDSALDFGTFTIGTNGLTGVVFNGEAVTFDGLNLSDSAVVINGERRAGLIAAGITLGSDQQVVWYDVEHTLNTGYLADSREAVYALKYADNSLTLTATDTLTVNGANNNFDQFATLANAVNAYDGFTGNYDVKVRTSIASGNSLTVKNATFTAPVSSYAALLNNAGEFSGENVFFNGGSATTHSGAIYNNGGTVTITGGSFANNRADGNSGAIRSTGVLDLDGVLFTGNTVNNSVKVNNGGAIRIESSGSATIKNSRFENNCAVNGGAIYNDGTLTLTNVTFSGNTAISGDPAAFSAAGNALYNSGTVTITDCTFDKGQTIYNNKKTVIFRGDIVFNASLGGGDDTHYDFTGANLILGAGAALNNLDVSAATITVDGTLYKGEAVTVATKVGKIGAYTIANNTDPFLTLEVIDSNLVLKEVAGETITGTSFTGEGVTVMDNGAVGTFFATKDDSKEIATKISGGKVEQNLVAGAYVAAGKTAAVDKVELNIGDADVAAKVYAGGYLYGNAGDAEAAAEAQLTVGEVNITLDGGAVSTNMYGGAHARDKGKAEVTTVNITITKGSHSRIYAGGWAEKGAASYVTTANVTISGGTVDYLYGAGANADGKTFVGTTNITIENDAVVNTIFMGGRYGYSWVDNVSLTFDGAEKFLKRLSGVSSAGMDYADATVVELETNVTADLIDYVDKFVINEDCLLTANDAFYLGNRIEGGANPGVTTFDFIAEGEANWTAVAGIDDFTNAKFAVNGSEAQLWDGKAALAIGDYELTYDAKDKTIKLAKITA